MGCNSNRCMNNMTKPVDGTKMTVKAIVEYFDAVYSTTTIMDFKPRKDFYCGITNNIENNLRRHDIDGYTTCVECASFDVSSEVEAKLGEQGFDIGNANNPAGNGGANDSTIVYMAFKETGFQR